MNYSTFNLNDFFIKKDSTLPELTYPLTQHTMEQYKITSSMLDNVAVTFSMMDAQTGLYRIANVPANLVINRDRPDFPAELEYTLMYRFKPHETSKAGRFYGEFKLDFLGPENCGKLTMPVDSQINILISDSITKTTVV
jgi:hypothetical protein